MIFPKENEYVINEVGKVIILGLSITLNQMTYILLKLLWIRRNRKLHLSILSWKLVRCSVLFIPYFLSCFCFIGLIMDKLSKDVFPNNTELKHLK